MWNDDRSRNVMWPTEWMAGLAFLVWVGGIVPIIGLGDEPKPSQYAPAADLIQYARGLVDRMAEDLGTPTEYGDEQIQRVTMHAHTLVAISMTLACHDRPHPLRGVSQELVRLSSKLASDARDFDDAKKDYEAIAKLVAQESDAKGGDGEWEVLADVAELMKAVPIINNQMRRGIQSRRFARSAERTATYAAALAAVAQVSSLDDSYCSDDEDFAKWKKLCAEMRDGAAEAASAIRAGDQERAKAAAARIVKTCDACHDDFR